MKILKLKYFFFLAILIFSSSCYDDFEQNFDTSSIYFPFQRPLRTIYAADRTIKVGVVLGGKRENNANELAAFRMAPELLPDGEMMLPLSHFEMDVTADSIITVPSGTFQGSFDLTLTDAFFQDPLSLGDNYVLPLKIVEATSDEVLLGRDFVLLKLKYINQYHGTYYQLGSLDGIVYKAKQGRSSLSDTLQIYDELNVQTTGVASITVPRIGDETDVVNNGIAVTVNQSDNSLSGDLLQAVNGLSLSDFVGEVKDNRSLVYTYTYQLTGSDAVNVYDSLVFRDDGVFFEEW